MIREWLQHLTTQAPRHIRLLGLVHEAVAIEARLVRCKAAWADHLENSKKQIEEIAKSLDRGGPGGEVIVLGSGGLHDVPLEALAAQFTAVSLWDVVHLRKTKRRAASFSNVTCHDVDVTGLCERFAGWLRGPSHLPPPAPEPPDLPVKTPALIISLNLASQLPLQMATRARKKKSKMLPDSWSDEVITAHLDWLKSHRCPVLLITDLEHRYKRGNTLEIEEVLPCSDLGQARATWTWHVAPKGETRYDAIHHRVGAFTWNVQD